MTLFRYATIAVVGLMLLATARADGDASVPPPSAAIDQKLSSIIVSIDFSNAKVDQAIGALAAMSKQLDPDRVGVQFVIQPEASTSASRITLKLDKVPLKVALNYVCQLGSIQYKVNDHSVSITSKSVGQDLVKRTFLVDPGFVNGAVDAGLLPAPKTP